MEYKRCSVVCVVALALLVGSCGRGPDLGGSSRSFVSTDAPWRAQSEEACLSAGTVDHSPWIRTRSGLGGPSVCGAARPLSVLATSGGRVRLKPAATLRCPMVPAVEEWMARVVQPAAQRHLRTQVVEMQVAASYSCRPRNNVRGAKLSEHGFANAIDLSVFRLANGTEVKVVKGWRGSSGEQAFLREIHRGACGIFSTVLGPNHDRAHHDHFHLDLARHGKPGRTFCR